MIKIVLTGGGTAGHVMPNVALLEYLGNFEVHYIGSMNGIEQKIMSSYENVTYHAIHTGKLRRYLSLENVKDFFRFQKGISDAKKLLKKIKPDIIFSKGGYVAVPVAIAAKKLKIPLITHESDQTPGLANKLITNSAVKVLTTFPETAAMIKDGKGVFSGAPIRSVLFSGSREKGLSYLGFNGNKPVLLIMGGSKGARVINEALYGALDKICEKFAVAHICGDGNIVENGDFPGNYRQFAFIGKELPDVLAATDFVITRGGSNSIHEFRALKLPMLIIPLSKAASRGDQILNANSFEQRGIALQLEEEKLTPESLYEKLIEMVEKKDFLLKNLDSEEILNGIDKVYSEIASVLKSRGIEV